MTNIFSHQKIVYSDLGRAKMFKNTCTTEKVIYVNVFLNMTNMFSHQKLVYRDLGTAKIFKNPPPKNM